VDSSAVAAHCLGKPGAEETYPWGEAELVVKVGGKAFAFLGDTSVTLKLGPSVEATAEWRQRYPDDVEVSAYIGRYGWNRVRLDGEVPDAELVELLDESYAAIVAKLPKSKRPADT
jgi:predicted DNA-binding protein (MmcQ/YjbR family)